MRILLITSMVPDEEGIGAMPKLFAAQLQGLREHHDVTLLSSFGEDRGQAEAAESLLNSGLDAHFADRRPSPSPLRRWAVRAGLATTWARRGWPWRVVCGAGGLQPLLDQLNHRRSFDVIAVEDNPVAVLRLPPGVPTVLTEHEAVRAPAAHWRASRLSERPLRALRARDWQRWDRFLPSIWERYDLLQVYCETDAQAVSRIAPELGARVRINPYGMLPPCPLDPAGERPGTILFSGTFAHLPNRDAARWLAGEIMPAVRARQPQAQLRIVGANPPREVIELAGPGVEVIADPPSMEPHLRAAAVVVAPVRSGGGMRMKVLEAIARQKAVVTTPLGAEGFSFFDGEPPFLIAEDGASIAAKSAELLQDVERRRELGLRARRFALAHHSPASWAKRLTAVYEEARHTVPAAIHGHQYPDPLSSPAEPGK